jgi:ABC-type nitrate/sulfonate/bicarbonate transport system ATPase subunit
LGRPPARADHAAYLFQQDLLLPWKTALGNAAFAALQARPRLGSKKQIETRARRLLEEFGMGEALGCLPHQLSGGMRQRVALARTLALDRGLVLLDEPFSSLDALTRAELHDWLLGVMGRHPATWVLVTHDVHEAVLLADRVAVLGGRPATIRGIVEVGLSRERRARHCRDELAEGFLRRAAAEVERALEEGRER